MNSMTILMGCGAAAVTALAVLGFILAFTVDPGAISMGGGFGIAAPFMWLIFGMMRHLDRM